MNPPGVLDQLDAIRKTLPAVPKEWALGLAQAAVALAVALGAPLDGAAQAELVGVSALALTLLVAGGTALRHARLKHLTPALVAQYEPEVVDALLAALQARTAAPTPARKHPVTRQLSAVEDAGATATAAQAENDPEPPPPGTYPTEPEPGPVEPTGS